MSMDIAVWSAQAPELPAVLPRYQEWERVEENGETSYWFDSEEFAISIDTGAGQPPRPVTKLVQNASWETMISLQPISAPRDGYLFLEQVVRTLCAASDGCWGIPGEDTFRRHNEGRF